MVFGIGCIEMNNLSLVSNNRAFANKFNAVGKNKLEKEDSEAKKNFKYC